MHWKTSTFSKIINEVISWLKSVDPKKNTFIWIHLYDVNRWRKENEEYAEDEEYFKGIKFNEISDFSQFLEIQHGMNPQYFKKKKLDLIEVVNRYDARIRYIDRQIERLAGYYEKRFPNRKTLWIITSDHGEGLGTHNYLGHGPHLYHEELHVPLIVYFSDKIFENTRIKTLVRLIDIFPTLVDLVSWNPFNRHSSFEGQSIKKLFNNSEDHPDIPYSFAQRRPADQGRRAPIWVPGNVYSLHDIDYKYILFTKKKDEFYSLKKDPHETKNLINLRNNIAIKMKKNLLSEMARMGKSKIKKEASSDRYVEELRSLQYVQ